jgi:mannosyltransferase
MEARRFRMMATTAREEPAAKVPRFAVLSGITAFAALLRLLYLGSKSPWLDEISSVIFARLSWPAFWQIIRAREANMLLYYLFLRGWIHLGSSEFVLRLPSVIAGVATVAVLYVLARDFFGSRAGFFCAALLSINAAHVRASQWMRSYSVLVLLIVSSMLLFARGIERPTRRTWAMYVLVTALAIYFHFMAGLVIAAQWLSLIFLRRRLWPVRHLVAAGLTLVALAAPAAFYIAKHNVGQLNWVANPRPIEIYHLGLFLAAGGGKVVGVLLLAICIALVAIAARASRRETRDLQNWHSAFLFMCLAFPPLASFLLSFWRPVFFYRYLIITLPPFILLIGRGLSLLRIRWLLPLSPVILGLSLAAVAISYRPEEDWKSACTYLLSHAQNNDVVLYSGRGSEPLDYYRWRLFGAAGGPRLRSTGYPGVGARGKLYAHFFPRVWYLHFPSFVTDPKIREVESHLAEAFPIRHESKFKAVTLTLYEAGAQPSSPGPQAQPGR